MECFCGCGRDVPRGMRSINRYGKMINHDGAVIRVLLDRGLRSPNAERFLREATAHCRTLADAVHTGERPPRRELLALEHYTRFSSVRFGDRALGSAVKRARMTSQDAMVELEAGRWDPFPDIEFPTPEAKAPAPPEFAPPAAAPPPARPPSWREVHEDT